jgi:hypothetical protein
MTKVENHPDPLLRKLTDEEYDLILQLKDKALKWAETWIAEENIETIEEER